VVEKGSDHPPEIIRPYPDIAVRKDQVVVARERHHVDEVAHLAVASMLPPIEGYLQIALRKLALQAARDGECGIALIGYAEYDLKLRIVLLTKGPQALVGVGLFAAQGLQ
jgi:hypothetical protein